MIERCRRWTLCLVVLGTITLIGTHAHAEPPAFKATYAEGKKALQSGDFERALSVFRQSLQDAGEHQAASWKGMIGVAFAFRGLEQPGYALQYYRRFLDASALHMKMLPPKWRARREAVEAEVGELENQALETHALVSVTSTPEGATLMIDGAPAGADGKATTPYPLYLKPGEHTVTISLEGHLAVTRSLTLSAGELVPLSATLEPEVSAQPSPSPPAGVAATGETADVHTENAAPLVKQIRVGEPPSMIGPYSMIGVGSALALAAVGLTVGATMENQEIEKLEREVSVYNANMTGDEARSYVDRFESHSAARDTMQMASNILYGVSIGVAVGGIIWMAVAESDSDASTTATSPAVPSIGLTPTSGGAMTSAMWRF